MVEGTEWVLDEPAGGYDLLVMVFANGTSSQGYKQGVVLHVPKLNYGCAVDLLNVFSFASHQSGMQLNVKVNGSIVSLTREGNQYSTQTALVRAWGIKF